VYHWAPVGLRGGTILGSFEIFFLVAALSFTNFIQIESLDRKLRVFGSSPKICFDR
jgi:hypothetical protein